MTHFARPDGTPSGRTCRRYIREPNGDYTNDCRKVDCHNCLARMTKQQLTAAATEGTTEFIRARASRLLDNTRPRTVRHW